MQLADYSTLRATSCCKFGCTNELRSKIYTFYKRGGNVCILLM